MDDLFNNWIYEKNADNSARFVLGERGENPLVCIGVNPSTAKPGKLDPTLRQVRNRAKRMGYDGWIMLNLYPQRATNPNDLHDKCDTALRILNENHILGILRKYKSFTVWAAWGTLITKRQYLAHCLTDIAERRISQFSCNWITIGKRSKAGHPHHPLYLSKDAEVKPFDVEAYLGCF